MILFDKVWFEAVHGGKTTTLLLSIAVQKIPQSTPIDKDEPFFISLHTANDVIGYLEVKRLAIIENEAVFETIGLHPANYQFPDGQQPSIALSSHLLGVSSAFL